MKTILFIAQGKTSFETFKFLIERIHLRRPDIHLVLFNDTYFDFQVKSDEYEIINRTVHETKELDIVRRIKDIVFKFFGDSLLFAAYRYYNICIEFNKYEKEARELLNHVSPDLIITNSDRNVCIAPFIIKNSKKTPCIIVPAGLLGDISVDASRKLEYRRFSFRGFCILNRYIASKYPRQVYLYNDRKVLYFDAPTILAMDKFDVLSECPWGEAGGKRSSLLCVSSMHDKVVNEKLIDVETIVTGTVEEYEIKEKKSVKEDIKKEVKHKYNIDTKQLCIFAIPNIYELGLCSKETQIKNVSILVEALQKKYGKILISLHPRSSKEDYKFVEIKYDAVILNERLRDAIVAADVFLTDAGSATLRWAILSGSKCIPIRIDDWSNCLSDKNIKFYMDCLLDEEKISREFERYDYYSVDEKNVIDIADLIEKKLDE